MWCDDAGHLIDDGTVFHLSEAEYRLCTAERQLDWLLSSAIGFDDLVVAAKCKNPMADKDEYSFVVADPYDSFLGYSDVKVTSTFASDEPDRRGICLLVIHGTEKEGWRAETPKGKFVLINLPFKTLTVKKFALKKKTVLGIYMEEKGEGEDTSSVVYWDGKKYRYENLGSTLE